jgi:hypothetical protein
MHDLGWLGKLVQCAASSQESSVQRCNGAATSLVFRFIHSFSSAVQCSAVCAAHSFIPSSILRYGASRERNGLKRNEMKPTD